MPRTRQRQSTQKVPPPRNLVHLNRWALGYERAWTKVGAK